jgi:diguanylate cyclase (GGDEF)-like protein
MAGRAVMTRVYWVFMKPDIEAQRELAHLRALLTMSRELLQTDQADGVFDVVGHAVAEQLHASAALLIVRVDEEQVVAFDSHGKPQVGIQGHPWYQAASSMLGQPCAERAEAIQPAARRVGRRVLALGVPVPTAMAALVVGWEHEADAEAWSERERILSAVLELAAAALGSLQSRSSLERLVYEQYEQMADTAHAHAAELARRDVDAGEMRQLSLTDVLTGLYNRRGFFIHAEQVFKLAQRKRARSAVIFADVDGLKRVNDELGHEAGDRLIRDAASVFRESFRDADVVARLGGDEFVAYTLDDGQPNIILSRLHANLHAFNLMQERPYQVSISAGVVQCDPASEQNLLNYIVLADQQMYQHKRRRLH